MLFGVAGAEDIFIKRDASGRTVFTSKPTDGAKKAELPEIKKEDLSEKIEALREQTPATCVTRGGINCDAGPDSDGSVICIDGSKDSTERWKFKCGFAKLRVVKATSTSVTVKNEGPATALETTLNSSCGELKGNPEVSAYGYAEYTFPKHCDMNYRVTPVCKNCSAVKSFRFEDVR